MWLSDSFVTQGVVEKLGCLLQETAVPATKRLKEGFVQASEPTLSSLPRRDGTKNPINPHHFSSGKSNALITGAARPV